nr:MAG TPA: hypothetical protein [Caudoviricetes sp.]
MSRGRGFAPRIGADSSGSISPCSYALPKSVYLFRHLRISPHQRRSLAINTNCFYPI